MPQNDANKFEILLANVINKLAETETLYNWEHPISFYNRIVTDPFVVLKSYVTTIIYYRSTHLVRVKLLLMPRKFDL
jgi:hypothetical protein